MKLGNGAPFYVLVTGDQWISLGDPNNRMHVEIQKHIVKAGGVNESVTPGTYIASIEFKRFRFYFNLDKVSD